MSVDPCLNDSCSVSWEVDPGDGALTAEVLRSSDIDCVASRGGLVIAEGAIAKAARESVTGSTVNLEPGHSADSNGWRQDTSAKNTVKIKNPWSVPATATLTIEVAVAFTMNTIGYGAGVIGVKRPDGTFPLWRTSLLEDGANERDTWTTMYVTSVGAGATKTVSVNPAYKVELGIWGFTGAVAITYELVRA